MKKVLYNVLNILLTIIVLMATIGILWYILPSIQTSAVGIFILSVLTHNVIFFITIGLAINAIIIKILNIFIFKNMNAKAKNFYRHIQAWVIAIAIVISSLYGFIFINPLIVDSVIITGLKKIGIGVILTLLIVFRAVSTKLTTMINRKIQSYEIAKELNAKGRSSIIFVNILKIFEIMFPEMLTLLLLSLFVSWNISSFFVMILVACFIILINNITTDLCTRKEIIKIKKQEQEDLVKKISDNIKGV